MKKLALLFIIAALFVNSAEAQKKFKNEWNFVDWNEFISYPQHSGVFVGDFCQPQFDSAHVGFPDFYNCHGYAWGIAVGYLGVPMPISYDWTNQDLWRLVSELNLQQCSAKEATHLTFYYPGEHPILDAQHSATISQFDCFPYEDGWIQSVNSPWPGTEPVVYKIDDYIESWDNNLEIAYWDLKDNGNLPFIQPNEPFICPAYSYAQSLAISGPSKIKINEKEKYETKLIPYYRVQYEWKQGGPNPSAAFHIYPGNHATECYAMSVLEGSYVLDLEIYLNNELLAVHHKPIYVVGKNFSVSPNPATTLIKITSEKRKPYKYEIISPRGSIEKNGFANTYEENVYVSNLEPGFYTIKITTENEIFQQRLIVK